MRISMFNTDSAYLDTAGLGQDRRGRGGYFGSHGGSQQQADSDDADRQDEPSIGDLLGAALGQYQSDGVFERSV